ncbi:MAG: ATP-binding protein [Verrucomicrobiae bacterium]|nr:ATP-binding protein [Verrucomicrobiae bacterium]
MKTKSDKSELLLKDMPFAFGNGFLDDHAGHIMSDTSVAIIELIANSYDAGATQVEIRWPEKTGEPLMISDNGEGMTSDEFNRRWKTLKYNRLNEQGEDVTFPPDVKAHSRKAFGRSGKGRHGAFCFADVYEVETRKDGQLTKGKISRANLGTEPFHCEVISVGKANGHGTILTAIAVKNVMDVEKIIELVGSKFAVDPEFQVVINGESVVLLNLEGVKTEEVECAGIGKLTIHEIEATQQERNTRFRGMTWWVNKRMVGSSSWAGLDEKGSILDGRTAAAKKYSFVIEADFLKKDVKPDWTGFFETKDSRAVIESAREHVIKRLHILLAHTRKQRKKTLIEQHRKAISGLTLISKKVVGQFIDEVQQNCPTLSEGDLSRTVEILTKLEQSRSGYDLLEKLSKCSPADLDTWNNLMEQWNATHAEIILNELGRRLRLIDDLTVLVHNAKADELHDLQPLFAKGLWIFGPEFESADFTSNRGMATVIRKLLGGTDTELSRNRPDIVALPESSLGTYAADSFDDKGEPNGFRSVVIVELKKGGFPLTVKEVRQAEDYVREIRKAKLVQDNTKITAYVLGATIEDAELIRIGDDDAKQIIPMVYDVVLRKAHARTFHLRARLEAISPVMADKEVEETLAEPEQTVFFDSENQTD